MTEPITTRNLDRSGSADLLRLDLILKSKLTGSEPHGATRWDFAH
ncbi:hypothetical protein [Amycolatopsis sp. 195334CR]|nr:hypothetical protein [Amycolatopsis sp. 195334CR]